MKYLFDTISIYTPIFFCLDTINCKKLAENRPQISSHFLPTEQEESDPKSQLTRKCQYSFSLDVTQLCSKLSTKFDKMPAEETIKKRNLNCAKILSLQ